MSLFVIYMIIIPALDSLAKSSLEPTTISQNLDDLTFADAVRLRTTEAFTAALFFTLGAVIGSFLNVIAYRTPRGESLIRQPSACPNCGSHIASRDNIPVLGWFWLNGKCRCCQKPISSRYPIVEATTGGLFLLFYFAELLSGGANLPVRTPNHYTGVVWIIFYTKWDLIGLFLYHCLLLVSLLTWSLIRFDQQHVPLKSYLTTFVLALVPPLIWPELQLVVLNSGKSATLGITLLTAGIGLLIGFVLGLLTIKTLGKGSSTTSVSEKYEFIGGIALTGVVLGWQAVCSVLVITLLFRRLQLSLAKSKSDDLLKLPLTGCLLLATVFQLTSWRIQASYMNHFWPVSGLSLAPVLVWASLTLFLLLILRNEIRTCSNELPEPEKSASLHHKQEVMNWTH